MFELIKEAEKKKNAKGDGEISTESSGVLFLNSLQKSIASIRLFTGIVSLVSFGIGFLTLAFWLISPAASFRFMQDHWIGMPPQAAALFCLLAAALIFYNKQPPSRQGSAVLASAGALVCALVLIDVNFSPPDIAVSPFTYTALFILGFSMAVIPLARGRYFKVGDALGVVDVFLVVTFIYFLICYCHGVRSILSGQIPCPHLLSVFTTVFLTAGIVGALGPDYFPTRTFVGPSVRASLLRKSLPLAVAVILTFVCVDGIMSSVLPPPFGSFLTLMASSLIVIYLVLRSSGVVGVQLEKALQESEQNYTHLVGGLKDHAVFLLNTKGEILVWNSGAEEMMGYKASDVLGEKVSRLFDANDLKLQLHQALEQVKTAGKYQMEGWAGRKGEKPFWAETSLSKLVDGKGNMIGASVIIRDNTARRKAEETMKASLLEKDVLLKEIHHRVKNNLQVISSLLRLQSEKVRDKKTASLFLDSQERVRAMAMVHEYLYKSTDLARINFSAYVASLVRNLYRSFGFALLKNSAKVEVDDVRLKLDLAVPCGLLLTELISNAIKHAYPDGMGGPLHIRFKVLEGETYQLSVEDEGVGFPENFNWMESDSLGLRLVRLLSEQLQGQIFLENKNGIKVTVTFKDQFPKEQQIGG